MSNDFPRSVSPRKHNILFSAEQPPAIQRIPWPTEDVSYGDENNREEKQWNGYDTWLINDNELPWLLDADGPSLYKCSFPQFRVEGSRLLK